MAEPKYRLSVYRADNPTVKNQPPQFYESETAAFRDAVSHAGSSEVQRVVVDKTCETCGETSLFFSIIWHHRGK